ncbi:MAG: hypothetical protein ACXADO_09225 [Candidatus Thorarchaeota archaeon]
MELTAIRGRNQKGISYVHEDEASLDHQLAVVTYSGARVHTDVRSSDKVPSKSMILDSRLFDALDCKESSSVEITIVDVSIPMCSEISLYVESIAGLNSRKVVEAVSRRIEDFKEHLDGLVLRVGQAVSIPELKLRLIVEDIHPVADAPQAARVSWRNVLKINLTPFEPDTSPGRLCFNMCIVSDVGAASKITDILEDEETSSSGAVDHENRLTRNRATLLVITHLLALPNNHEQSLVASIAYAEKAVSFSTTDLPDDNGILSFSSKSLGSLGSWVSAEFAEHSSEPSNPGAGLLEGLKTAEELTSDNGLKTAVVLLSGGAFSAGQNPVSVVRGAKIGDRVKVFCIGLGVESDHELLEAIANAVNGQFLKVHRTSDVILVGAELSKWGRCNQ